jgi:cell division protein FtsB
VRWLALAFVALIAALQYPMWLGKGGWLQVRNLDRQLSVQQESNARLKARNDALDADVRDLKNGFEAIEDGQAGRSLLPASTADTPAGSRHRIGRLRHAFEPADPPGGAVSRKALSAMRATARATGRLARR